MGFCLATVLVVLEQKSPKTSQEIQENHAHSLSMQMQLLHSLLSAYSNAA